VPSQHDRTHDSDGAEEAGARNKRELASHGCRLKSLRELRCEQHENSQAEKRVQTHDTKGQDPERHDEEQAAP
jgi:hypothetical protein